MADNAVCAVHKSELRPDKVMLKFGLPDMPDGYFSEGDRLFANANTRLFGGEPFLAEDGEDIDKDKLYSAVRYCARCRASEKNGSRKRARLSAAYQRASPLNATAKSKRKTKRRA